MAFVIFHLKLSIERKTKINIKKSIEIEHAAPLLDTPKGFWFTAVHNIQGNGNLIHKNNRNFHVCLHPFFIILYDQ
jgi:hypothetical protein